MAKTVVGLDIGSSHIRGIERSVDKNGNFSVKAVASIKLSDVAVKHGEIVDEELLVKALKMLWKEAKFSTKEVNIGINGDKTITRVMVLPWEKEFSKVLPFLIEEQNIGIDRTKYYMDHYTLDEFNVKEHHGLLKETVRKKRILFTAIEKETVDGYIRALKTAGLKVVSVDLSALALLRSHDWSAEESTQNGEVNVNVDIGSNLSTVVISRYNRPIYVRVMPNVGGDVITKAIQKHLDIPLDQAEELKISTGNMTPQPYTKQRKTASIFDENNPSEEEPDAPEISPEQRESSMVIAKEASAIITNIQETINDYFNRSRDTDITELNRIIISGGLSNLHVIMRRLSIELDAHEVVIASPFDNLASNGGDTSKISQGIMEHQNEFSIALGLIKNLGVNNE